MAVSSAFGKKAAKKFLSQQKNIPENWLLGILPRDVVTRDRIYSMKVTNPDSAEDDHITILVIMITDGAPPKILEDYREKYHSLFLSNYRESKDICRKRISFDLVSTIVGYLLL